MPSWLGQTPFDGASTLTQSEKRQKELIARHASSALEDEMNEEVSNEIEIAIKVHAADLLGEKATSHLKAKLEERRKILFRKPQQNFTLRQI